MRKHRKIRRDGKKTKKIIIVSMIGILCIMTAGYAAFQTNLNITAKGNVKYRTDFYVSQNGSDEQGNGTKEKPYKTIQKAYDMAKTEARIYVTTDLEINKTINFNQNKKITLKSDNETPKINTLIRTEEMSYLLNINSGETTIENIIFDGKNIEANASLLCAYNNAILNINEGAVFQNNIDTKDYGGGLNFITSTITFNGGKIVNNISNGGGGGGIIANHSTIVMNNVEISNNSGLNGGGIFLGRNNHLTINYGKIINNTASRSSGGGITIASSTAIINDGEISGNTATTVGGGVYIAHSTASPDIKGTFIMAGGTICNNKATNGGGVYVNQATFDFQKGTVENNTPNDIIRGQIN